MYIYEKIYIRKLTYKYICIKYKVDKNEYLSLIA